MEYERIPRPGDIYRHYKDKLYQIITVAIHTESNEPLVIYQALYGDFRTYARPLESFNSELNPQNYPEAKQKRRFELVRTADADWINANDATFTVKSTEDAEIKSDVLNPVKTVEVSREVSVTGLNKNTGQKLQDEEASEILLKFLEANTYYEKLEIVATGRKHLNDRIINNMAVALDCTVEDGPLDERIESLINCLQAMCRFEPKRLRTGWPQE